MPTIYEMGLMANAVYGAPDAVPGWTNVGYRGASGALNGFQAAAFARGSDMVIAYRGTSQAMDVAADLKLGTGMNSTYFSAGEEFLAGYQGRGTLWVVGHSLGGAIAQVVANRKQVPMVTFNAPGVAVLASRNMGTLQPMMGIRMLGATASMFRHPIQAYEDVKSTFHQVKGINISLEWDAVSQIGIHYGNMVRIPGLSRSPLEEHRMTTFLKVLQSNPIGQKPAESYL